MRRDLMARRGSLVGKDDEACGQRGKHKDEDGRRKEHTPGKRLGESRSDIKRQSEHRLDIELLVASGIPETRRRPSRSRSGRWKSVDQVLQART